MSREEIMEIFKERVQKVWQEAIQYPQPVADLSGYEEGAWNKWLRYVVDEADQNSWQPIVTELEEKYDIYIHLSSPFFTYFHKYGSNMRVKLIEMAKQKEIDFARDAEIKRQKDIKNREICRNIEAPVEVQRPLPVVKAVPDWQAKKPEKEAVISWLDFRWKDMFG
jgi:hypothetical protein